MLKRPAILAGLAVSSLGSALPASATFLDSDFFCRTYGCVIVHDGTSFDVYDNFDFASGTVIAPGQALIPRAGNPVEGAGSVNPVITGTLTEALSQAPMQDQGLIVGIDRDGDGIPDILPSDNNNSGYLDAGDSFDPFNLTPISSLETGTTSAQRSFYLTSINAEFRLTARVYPATVDGLDMTAADFDAVTLVYQITTDGTDDGMTFGRDAQNGKGFYRDIGNVDTLADLLGGPTDLVLFRREIRKRASSTLAAQSVRFDYVYAFDRYDLSMGAGDLRYRIEFDIYRD